MWGLLDIPRGKNENNKQSSKKTKASDNGKKTFQHSRINWSIRYLGNDALTQIKKNKIIDILAPNVIDDNNAKSLKRPIDTQPPINAITVKALINIIELYSAKKNKAKPIAAYSTL